MADDDFPDLSAAATQTGKKKGPPPPRTKQKKEKISLGDFLGGDSNGTGSWADEMDALPSAPSARQEMGDTSGQLGGGFARLGYSGADRGGPARQEIPLPDNPPFTAFIGNLSFDLTESDISKFFGGEGVVTSVRIVMDTFENKPKGFGYVEFKTKDDLAHALGASGESLGSRPIRVTVAEPPRRSGGFADRGGPDAGRRGMFDESGREEGRSMGDWSRSGPLPPLETRGGGPPRPSMRSASSGFERESAPDVDWGAARGGRFQPSQERQPSFGGGGPRSAGGPLSPLGEGRPPMEPSKADEASQWRRASQSNSPSAGASPAASTPASPALTRRKLELAPRTVSSSGAGGETPTSAAGSSKPSPFGNAAPVNTAERERAIEEKLAASRKASEAAAPPPRSASGSGPRVDPFGAAKPIDTMVRDKEVEGKIRERQASVPKDAPPTPTEKPAVSPNQSLRKEGFSYSKMASSTNDSPVVPPTNQFEKLAVEGEEAEA